MSDTVGQARAAREKLAAALSILQSPEAGTLIDTVAEPVARAMGALHQLETTEGEGASEKAPAARDAVREALAALQTAGDSPIADDAMAHIAGSLGVLHGLAQAALEQAQAAPAEPPAPAAGLDRTQLASEPIAEPQIKTAAAPAPAAPGGVLDATLPTPTQSPFADGTQDEVERQLASTQASARHSAAHQAPGASKASDQPSGTAPTVAQPSAAPRAPAGLDATQQAPAAEDERPAPAAQVPAAQARSEPKSAPPAMSSKHASLPPDDMPDGALQLEANLGAHSPTNFYKGLSGNDVVDDGGLFVATYDIPKMGASLWLQVNMPGGYDFQAAATVRWTRESGVGDAPPGFGCAFTSISSEARHLIYRYVRNREPLFHDDL